MIFPWLSHDVETAISKQTKRPGFLTSRKLIKTERAAKHSACSKADDCFRRVSPPAYKQVVERLGAERVGFSLVERCNGFFDIVARYLRPEVVGH